MESWTLDYSPLKENVLRVSFGACRAGRSLCPQQDRESKAFSVSRLTVRKVSLGLPLKFPATFPNRAWNQLLGAKMLIPWPDPRVASSEASGPTESHMTGSTRLGKLLYNKLCQIRRSATCKILFASLHTMIWNSTANFFTRKHGLNFSDSASFPSLEIFFKDL